jgi:YD repeat-containing protein
MRVDVASTARQRSVGSHGLGVQWGAMASAVVLGVAATLVTTPAVSQMVGTSVLPQPPERVVLDQNHVDVTTGALSLTFPELSIGSDDVGMQLIDYLGVGDAAWRSNFTGVLTLTMSYSQVSTSASWGNASWTFGGGGGSISGDGAALHVDVDGNYILTMRDGTVVTYSLLVPQDVTCPVDLSCYAVLFAVRTEYPNGLVITPHYRTYYVNPLTWMVRQQSVTNNAGYQIKFYYQTNDPTSTSANWTVRTSAVAINNAVEYCDPLADACTLSGNWPTVTYGSTVQGWTMTDALDRTTRITLRHAIAPGVGAVDIKTAASAVDNIQYIYELWVPIIGGSARRVTSATIGGRTWSYTYPGVPPILPPGNPISPEPYTLVVVSTDPLGNQTTYTSQRNDVPTGIGQYAPVWALMSVKDPLNRVTSFSYPCFALGLGYLNTSAYNMTLPEGNRVTRVCDERGNVISVTLVPKAGSEVGSIASSAVFSATCYTPTKICNQPTATVDGRGAQTDYTYDSSHGGVLTETRPTVPVWSGGAVASVRPQKRYSYAQYYAYVKNASGNLVQAASPIWMPTQVSECNTSASCTGGSDETIYSFEYGAVGAVNRLLPRGKVVTSGGVSLRTCYAYDVLGNKISETTPRAGLSSCP